MYEPCNENRTTSKISLMMSREDKVEVAQFIIDRFYEYCERDGLPPFAAFAKAKAAATKRLRAPAHFPSSLLKARRVRQG